MDPRSSDAILTRLMALHPKKIDLSLGRTLDILERLGRPQDKLPPVVHVAGTNGKGSLIAFLRAILEAAGNKVHAYTSPHLVRFNERIRVAGTLIAEDRLAQLLAQCETVNDGRPITFFEITTAAALLAFANTPADIVLLETGLGGRHDSTNVVKQPVLTAITPVSIDHVEFLGGTLAEIAAEKAAIQKPGVPSVIGQQHSQALAVIEAQAKDVGAPLSRHGLEWAVSDSVDGVRVRIGTKFWQFPAPALHGPHQFHNAAMAVACLEKLPGFGVTNQAIATGITHTSWPGRLQRLCGGPLVSMLPPGWALWLDGGHNAAAGAVLAGVARNWRDRPFHLVVGMLNTKDTGAFLRPMADYTMSARGIAIVGEAASQTAEQIASAARSAHIRAMPAKNLEQAIDDIVTADPAPGRILICGSLYLAGAVLAQND
jgi:dihydrofolate synthase/folylpolyglutamate synthase